MDPRTNPFSPGAGTMPPELSGRSELIDSFDILLARLGQGRSAQSMIVTGLRGVGKTVLLNRFGSIAEERDWVVVEHEASPAEPFGPLIANMSRKALYGIDSAKRWKDRARSAAAVLKTFAITVSETGQPSFTVAGDIEPADGRADSGVLASDLTDLLLELGAAAQERGRGIVFLIDEVQFISQDSLGALILALHKTGQKQLPITLAAAGLPQLPKLSGEAKSYAERLFRFPQIGSLDFQSAEQAIRIPLSARGISITRPALDLALAFSGRYPYFLQEIGSASWNIATDQIDLDVMRIATQEVQEKLDEGFFRVRTGRTTALELAYLRAMAELGAGPYRSGDVARTLGYEGSQQTGPMRAQLISKGLIYTTGHGLMDFTVPLFDDYLRRTLPFRTRGDV